MIPTFHRTPRGLSNLALFARVDVIVFAEGGRRYYTLQEIEDGAGEDSTADAAFWTAVIRTVRPTITLQVRSVGNKQTVTSIASLISKGAITKSVAALDRDFDDRRKVKLAGPNIFYTHGYSWENDVFTQQVLLDVLTSVCPPSITQKKYADGLTLANQQLQQNYKSIVLMDHTLAESGLDLTRREQLESAIRLDEKGPPHVDRSLLAQELHRCKCLPSKPKIAQRLKASVERDLHGHTVARWWLAYVHHLLRSHSGFKMNRELITRLAISSYVRQSSPSLQYYRAIIAAASV